MGPLELAWLGIFVGLPLIVGALARRKGLPALRWAGLQILAQITCIVLAGVVGSVAVIGLVVPLVALAFQSFRAPHLPDTVERERAAQAKAERAR